MKSFGHKIASFILLALVGLTSTSPVYAGFELPAFLGGKPPVREYKIEVREERQEEKEERKESREELRERISSKAAMLKSTKRWGRAAISSGEVTAIDGTTLVIKKDDTIITVLTDDKTQFRRRFWGKGFLSEIAVGHSVNVIGQWVDEEKTTIQARIVRDVSIQKRYGVFFGVIQSLTDGGWVMTTVSGKRENQTVTIGASTKLVNRKEETITKTDIVVGHRVRVKGLWDRENNTVTEVTHVKDFNLPVVPTVSVTPTPAAAATATPTVTPTPTPMPTI